MANFLRTFSAIERKVIHEVASRSVESEETNKHEEVEDPDQWTPPAMHATDIYKLPMTFVFKKKNFLKEVEITIKISGPSVQIVSLNIFSHEEIKKFQKYHKEGKYYYLHFGGLRIGLAPLFRHGIDTPCIVELFDTRHQNYDHARIGTITGNLVTGCQYGTIYPDYAVSLNDVHLKECWKLLTGVQGLTMVDDSEYLSVIGQASFQLTNTAHPKLKQPVLKDCVTVGLSNAQVEGVTYDQAQLPQDWYFQYKSIADSKSPESKLKRVAINNGQVQLIPPKVRVSPPVKKPRKIILPVNMSQFASEKSDEPESSSHELSPHELYIPETKPFLPVVNKMHRIGRIPPREEWQYNSKRYVRGGKWPPKTKFCTTSSSSNQPPTRADCAPLVEHNSQNATDLSENLQIGNYLATWCSHAEGVLDDLGCQTEQILANLKLLQDEQDNDRKIREEKERRRKLKKKRESRPPKFSRNMEIPQNWESSDSQSKSSKSQPDEAESSVSASRVGFSVSTKPPMYKNKSDLATFENAATLFPTFIQPSLQKANRYKQAKEPKYPRIEEDLFAANMSGYILDLDKSSNPEESIRAWIGALYQMQVVSKMDNISIFLLAEKRMTGVVWDWWMTASPEERGNVAACGLATLETLMLTQFVPEPTDEKRQLLTDLSRMQLQDLRDLDEFGQAYMAKVFKAKLSNDYTQKVAFLSKLPGNLGDMVMKDIELQGKKIEQIYWVDLLFRCREKVKYLCWQKQVHDITPNLNVCRTVLPWTPFKGKRRKHKKYGKYRPKKVSNPKRPFRKFRYVKRRKNPKRDSACFICKKEGHFARKCPKTSSNKLKACFDIEEFQDDWSIVDSEDDVSDVYLLAESEDDQPEEYSQMMNIIEDGNDESEVEEYYSEDELEHKEDSPIIDESSSSEESSETVSTSDSEKSNPVFNSLSKPLPTENSLCPYPKTVASTSTFIPNLQAQEQENQFLKKIVKTSHLLYIPVEVQVRGEWSSIDAFIDTGGSNHLARPSLFKGLWKPLNHILRSETIGGSVSLTHYVDNITMKLGGVNIKISAIQHYDASASLLLGMPFINSVLPFTISEDKVICNIKSKAIAVPRLTIANSEPRKGHSQKRLGLKKLKNQSHDWKEVLTIYESKTQPTQKASRESTWSPEQTDLYEQLLKCCSNNPQAFWITESPKQEIITMHDNGVTGKMIPCTPAEEKEMRKQVEELLDLQLIERSESHYSCSAFLVRNHSEIVRGKDRMVINYKPLNAITKSFNYPLPRQETIMQKIQGSKIFSKFDMKSGYYQIQIAAEDRHKTAFKCPVGFYQWRVVPFGLKNAPAFFQRRMDHIFGKHDFIVVYIDDILVHSPDLQSHLQHLRIFLEEAKNHGLVLSEKKMVLFQDQIDFLGIHISQGKIQLQPHVLTKLSEFPDQLHDKAMIQRFIGILNYVHRYIPNLSEKTSPIRQYLNGGWSDQATRAVQKLKEECKSLPALKPPGDGFLILQTDASDNFWAATLFEETREGDQQEEILCAYASGEFQKHQKNYFPAEKETLAIFNGIQKFELYLAPKKFLVRTDSMNFKYFLTAKISKQLARGRLLAWQMWFQMYDFDVEWIPGNENYLPDSLTREMNKMHVYKMSIFDMPGKPDSFTSFVQRFKILEYLQPDVTEEIKKIVGLRLRRNQWIQKCHAWQNKNVGIFLDLNEALIKVYSLPNLQVKLYFILLDDTWDNHYTPEMIKILKTLNYYQIIGAIQFSISVFVSSKMLDLEEVNMNGLVDKFLKSLRIPDLYGELEATYLQRPDENFQSTDSFPQYEILQPFADWEMRNGRCQKKIQPKISKCILKTYQYLRVISSPWDYHSLEFRKPFEPNPFGQLHGSATTQESLLASDPKQIRKVSQWLQEFPRLKLDEKISMLRTLEPMQGRKGVLRLSINQKSRITICISSADWEEDAVCLISLLLSNAVCSSMIFELGWQGQGQLSNQCKLWVQAAIEQSVSMFQIFKWELLDGVELAVQTLPDIRSSRKDNFLGIEIDPLAYINRWDKDDYTFPSKITKATSDIGQSSRAPLAHHPASSSIIIHNEKGKGKADAKSGAEREVIYMDAYQDAQTQNDPTWERDYLQWLTEHSDNPQRHYSNLSYTWQHQSSPASTMSGSEYDSDRSPKGEW